MGLIHCSVGVMAHNEEANIGRLLQRLLEQHLTTVSIAEIIVVASGCTDCTEEIVHEYAARDRRIKLLTQPTREGKASGVNLFLRQASEAVVVLSSADVLPDVHAIQKLVEPLADPDTGMTSCRPVPVNKPDTFMGFAAHLLWNLHHEIAQKHFKAGEMTAFRLIFQRIPYDAVVDEASVEPVIKGQGYRTIYVPEAIVHNKGPETVSDFLRQRRRNYAGHLAVHHNLGYVVSTMSPWRILGVLLRRLDWRPRQLLWTAGVVALEMYGRWLGWRDFCTQRQQHVVWEIAKTTKRLT
ncbi:MAG: glycosyltransferase [Anaerolineae bacterium]|nr:MAG: glycosyltransferase [Anaerolineae bacterium]